MARRARPRWDKRRSQWVARIGEKGPDGRANEVYAPRSIGREDEAGAWTWFQAEQERRQAPVVTPGEVSVDLVCEGFLADLERRARVGEVTVQHYRNVAGHLGLFLAHVPRPGGPRLGTHEAAKLTVDHLSAFLEAVRPGYSAVYCRHLARSVIQAMRWACRNTSARPAFLDRNPFEGFQAPTVPEMPERYAERRVAAALLWYWYRKYLHREGCGDVTRGYDRQTLLLERVILHTGARPKELARARWEDVKWAARTTNSGHTAANIVLPYDRWKSGKKTGRSRTIYLTPTMTRALRRHRQRNGEGGGWIFRHGRGRGGKGAGEPWADGSAIAKVVKRVRELQDQHRRGLEANGGDAGLLGLGRVALPLEGAGRVVNYLWRHVAASDLLMSGVEPVTVAKLLGTSVEMLQRHYGHLLDEHLGRAADTLHRRRR